MSSLTSPPKFPLRFFRWFCHPDYAEDIEGDLLERFEKRMTEGKAAQWLFFIDVIRLLRPGLIRNFSLFQRFNQMGMLNNYFKIGLRSILRHKAFSLLNIAGLSIGIASSVLILTYIQNELSYDSYHTDQDRIYRVTHASANTPEELAPSPEDYRVWGNAPVAPAMSEYFPGVQHVFRFTSPKPWLIEYKSKSFQENDIVFADSTAFSVFSWKMLKGDPVTALNRPNTIVLSERLAEKYFGDEDPIGKVLIMDSESPFEVTGVMENIPQNSSFTFDGMISMATFQNRRSSIFTSWGYVDFYTYFKVKPAVNIATLEAEVPQFVEKYIGDEFGYHIKFESLSSTYMESQATRQPGVNGSKTNIIVFSAVAIFLLLIACINFMNLTTSRSVERAKDVAIRKTVGSSRVSLIFQFLIEATLLTFFSAVLAIGIISISLPYLEVLSAKELSYQWLLSPDVLIIAVLGIVFVGLLAGSYPAFVLSSFQPVKVLRGAFKTSKSGVRLRKALVVVQFGLSLMLVIGTGVVYSQLEFMQNHDLGFKSEQVMVIDFGYDEKVQQKISLIKSKFKEHPNVTACSYSRAAPGGHFPNAHTLIEGPSGEMVTESPYLYEIDEDFIPTYDMEVVAGRNYFDLSTNDSVTAIIINEAAANLYGYNDPSDVVGKRFDQWGREGRVIGVVKDFNFKSLHHNVEPLSLRYARSVNSSVFSVRLKTSDLKGTMEDMESIWSEMVPHRPFKAQFVDDAINRQYDADIRFGSVFRVFSFIAIFIACLGLFGLTIYATAQRTKEIGIRKVLGASVFSIVYLLSVDFIKLFVVSMVVAIPASWFIMTNWLENFSYSISLGWEVFAIATIVILLISLVTMSLRTVSASTANPVKSLRDE